MVFQSPHQTCAWKYSPYQQDLIRINNLSLFIRIIPRIDQHKPEGTANV
jgi:hypothetical protein